MSPSLGKKVFLAGLLIALLLAISAPQAEARWGRCCGGWGWGSCGWGGCGWYSCGWGGCYNYYGCGWYGYGYPYWSGSCCGATVAPAPTGTSAPANVQPTPVPSPTPAPPPQPAPAAPGTSLFPASETGTLAVVVPADARVIVNGYETKSKGAMREYASGGLKPGYRYQYAIEARVVRDGRTIAASRTVYLQGGQNQRVVFALPSPAQDAKEFIASVK